MSRAAIIPAIRTSPSPSIFTASETPDAVTTGGPPLIIETGIAGTILKELQKLRPLRSRRPGDLGERDMRLRDPARDRDATSWGLRNVPMSGKGAMIAATGLAAGAGRLLINLKLNEKIPVSVGPTMCQGGGGISLSVDW